MSVEATKTDETTPVLPKTEQTSETPAVTETPAVDTTEAPSTTPATDAPAAITGDKKDETAVEAVPTSEGVLGYKAPGFLKQFHFSKHHFWFSDEPVAADSLHQVREKHGNEHAAWARETGKGALFFSKRAEDKGTPNGMILLHEASDVAKEGFNLFSVKVGDKVHKFEAASAKERDSWIVAFEKKLEEAKGMKDQVTGSESYKKNLEKYSKPNLASTGTAAAVKKDRSKSKEPKKSVEGETAPTAAATTTPAATETTKAEETPASVEEKKKTEKERSQSRKRTSIFGNLLKKDEQKSEEKKEDKADKKAEKEIVKEEKKAEAEHKKEEAKATHEPNKAVEATEAAAVAAVPAAVVSSDKKEEKKEEEKNGTTTPTDKKAKRGSVFGTFFQKKNVTSPTAEKTETESSPVAKDTNEVPPVSENAPHIDEPIDTKPLDAAAVTAPVTHPTEPTTEETTKTTTATPATEPQKTEKKGNFLTSFIKKAEGKKEESKEEKPAGTTTTDATPVTDGTTETATETPASKDERPAPEQRRSSLFGGLGNLKKKSDNKEETTKPSEEVNGTETKDATKREKSPLPNKIGGLFRRASNAFKSDSHKESHKETSPTSPATDATPATTEAKDTPATTETAPATAPETTDSKIIGDVVPEAVHAQTADKVATAPEVKASA